MGGVRNPLFRWVLLANPACQGVRLSGSTMKLAKLTPSWRGGVGMEVSCTFSRGGFGGQKLLTTAHLYLCTATTASLFSPALPFPLPCRSPFDLEWPLHSLFPQMESSVGRLETPPPWGWPRWAQSGWSQGLDPHGGRDGG